MELNPFRPNKIGIPIFMVGAVIGFALFLVIFFQDTEAIVFSPLLSGESTLRAFSCPEIITPQETGTVRAKIHNPTAEEQYRSIRTHITQGHLLYKREFNDHFYLEPGETQQVSWTVYPEDAAYGYVILAKVHFFQQDPLPSYVGACGIMLLDVPYIQGWHFILVTSVVSFSLMGVGYRRYVVHNQLLLGRKRTLAVNMAVIASTVILAIGTMFLENWYLELGFFVFTIILLAESVFFFSQS
ncbi:MAG: hypothetical protein GWN14_08295 [candidate division Zixibacteria bacterium]|nr:hypothetical protein [Gammaproteobacteria bacterium]NIX55912.1 hypothetical protein [candidate division Zixibacteria bacterium]